MNTISSSIPVVNSIIIVTVVPITIGIILSDEGVLLALVVVIVVDLNITIITKSKSKQNQ